MGLPSRRLRAASFVLLASVARGTAGSRDPLRRLSSALGLDLMLYEQRRGLKLNEVAQGGDAAGGLRARSRALRADGAEASTVSASDAPTDGAPPPPHLARLDHPRQLPRSLVVAFCVVAVVANGVFLVYIF